MYGSIEAKNTREVSQRLDYLQRMNPDKKVGIIDVGANKGWFTLAAASKGYHALSFEPS